MSYILGWILAVILIIALQSSLLGFIAYEGVKPDLVLVFVTFVGVLQGRTIGLVVGFVCGLCLDLLNTGTFGFYTLTLALAGTICGMIQKKVYEDSVLLPFVLVFAFSVGQQLFWIFTLLISGYNITSFSALLVNSLIKIFYNTLLTLPLLFLFARIKRAFS